jgi:hypothetical protein
MRVRFIGEMDLHDRAALVRGDFNVLLDNEGAILRGGTGEGHRYPNPHAPSSKDTGGLDGPGHRSSLSHRVLRGAEARANPFMITLPTGSSASPFIDVLAGGY